MDTREPLLKEKIEKKDKNDDLGQPGIIAAETHDKIIDYFVQFFINPMIYRNIISMEGV